MISIIPSLVQAPAFEITVFSLNFVVVITVYCHKFATTASGHIWIELIIMASADFNMDIILLSDTMLYGGNLRLWMLEFVV